MATYPQWSLLEMTQFILSSMDSDEVTSISDTTESLQVANVIKGVYTDLVSYIDMPPKFDFYQLTETGVDTPLVMTLPTTVQSLEWMMYDHKWTTDTLPNWKWMRYVTLDEFFERTIRLQGQDPDNTVSTFTLTIGSNSWTIPYLNDKSPECYTTFDDQTILVDSIDTGVTQGNETFASAAKTLCYGKQTPVWNMSDSFVPQINSEQFSLLINKAKDRCFAELKQMQNQNAIRETRAQLIHQQRTQKEVRDHKTGIREVPNYGRKPSSGKWVFGAGWRETW